MKQGTWKGLVRCLEIGGVTALVLLLSCPWRIFASSAEPAPDMPETLEQPAASEASSLGDASEAPESGEIEIATAEELLALAQKALSQGGLSGNYRLTADINLAGIAWTPFAFSSGRFDGAGHTIYNLSVTGYGPDIRETRDGNLKTYDTVFAGLFGVLENAEVYDLSITGAEVRIESCAEHCFAGILTGYADRAVISGCCVSGRVFLENDSGINSGIAGIAGYGCGRIDHCDVSAELVFVDRNTDRRCEEFLGGILSCGIADITDCTVAIEGYDSCRGYVHNGGICGMFYHCGTGYDRTRTVSDNLVTGQISFFEDNPDRRAYCEAVIGERLTRPAAETGNVTDFLRNETWDYSRIILPEACEVPSYREELVPADCGTGSWGYTVHTCETCGYVFRDSYAEPVHIPGEAETVRDTDYGQGGLQRISCTVCGALLLEEEIPPLIASRECILGMTEMELAYRDVRYLSANVLPADASDTRVIWSSSNPDVATVDEAGNVTATGRGMAIITCESADGFSRAECEVSVKFTALQWLIWILLFGWAWY